LKQTAAILILALLLFNWCGYRFVTSLMALRAEQEQEARIDDGHYEESDLFEVRIDLDVPYQLNQPDFERHYGEVEVDGRYYSYVKRKIENGQLVLLCIPNDKKTDVKAAGEEYYSKANGLQFPKSEKAASTAKKPMSADFDDRLYSIYVADDNSSSNTQFISGTEPLTNVYIAEAGKPPCSNA
jgi:hypothetical protein